MNDPADFEVTHNLGRRSPKCILCSQPPLRAKVIDARAREPKPVGWQAIVGWLAANGIETSDSNARHCLAYHGGKE